MEKLSSNSIIPTGELILAWYTNIADSEEGKIFHSNDIPKWSGMTMLISDKTYFKSKMLTREKEGHYFTLKD